MWHLAQCVGTPGGQLFLILMQAANLLHMLYVNFESIFVLLLILLIAKNSDSKLALHDMEKVC